MPFKFERSNPPKSIQAIIENDEYPPKFIIDDKGALPEAEWIHPGVRTQDVYQKISRQVFGQLDVISPREIVSVSTTPRVVRSLPVPHDLVPNAPYHWELNVYDDSNLE